MAKHEIEIEKKVFELLENIERADKIDASFFAKYFPQITGENFLNILNQADIEVDANMLEIHKSLNAGKRSTSKLTGKTISEEPDNDKEKLAFHTAGKTAVVSKISADVGITRVAAANVITSIIEIISKTLKKGGTVTLPGFGTFSVSQRAARTGKNPQTGSALKIKAKKVTKFKPAEKLNKTIH